MILPETDGQYLVSVGSFTTTVLTYTFFFCCVATNTDIVRKNVN